MVNLYRCCIDPLPRPCTSLVWVNNNFVVGTVLIGDDHLCVTWPSASLWLSRIPKRKTEHRISMRRNSLNTDTSQRNSMASLALTETSNLSPSRTEPRRRKELIWEGIPSTQTHKHTHVHTLRLALTETPNLRSSRREKSRLTQLVWERIPSAKAHKHNERTQRCH